MLFKQLNPHSCQTYLIVDDETNKACLVDPVLEHVDDYLRIIAEDNVHLSWVVDTHTHADHISGSPAISDRADCHYVMHASAPAACVSLRIKDGYQLDMGHLKLTFIHTPGHSPDSVCLLLPDRLLTGDTLLLDSDGIGRNDLQGGSADEHWNSLRRLLQLRDDLLVFPSHQYCPHPLSTWGEQKRRNPFLQQPDSQAFQQLISKESHDPSSHLPTIQQANYSCAREPQDSWRPIDQLSCPIRRPLAIGVNEQPVFTISPEEIERKLDNGWKGMLLDVREEAELVGPLGHLPGIQHIPLGQLTHRLGELAKYQHTEITILCRTNPRAHTAAQILRQAGFDQLVVMEGGMVKWQVLGYPAIYTPLV